MIRIAQSSAAVIGVLFGIQASAADQADHSVMAASQWPAYSMLSSEDSECVVDRPAPAPDESASRLSDMLSQHRVITRLPFGADVTRPYPEPKRLKRHTAVGHCS